MAGTGGGSQESPGWFALQIRLTFLIRTLFLTLILNPDRQRLNCRVNPSQYLLLVTALTSHQIVIHFKISVLLHKIYLLYSTVVEKIDHSKHERALRYFSIKQFDHIGKKPTLVLRQGTRFITRHAASILNVFDHILIRACVQLVWATGGLYYAPYMCKW